jgi:hypothetical protein
MSIDDHIEALTQAVELLARIHTDNEQANAKLWAGAAQRFAEAAKRSAEAEKRSAETERRLREVTEAINTLGRIAGLHQDRLDEHGERQTRKSVNPKPLGQ